VYDSELYDEGYKQALIDVAKFIDSSPIPHIDDTYNKLDFWQLLRNMNSSDKNKFAIFSSGYRVAVKELKFRIENLAKNI
jgi:hypothetical protein